MQKKPPLAEPASLSRGLVFFLYLTAAIAGAAVMIVEILGAKMLAPFLGTSHFVWTAQIAITLLALAAGYYFGGKLADRSPDLRKLYWAIMIAAIYLCLTVFAVEPVANWSLRFKLAAGALITSTFLFFIPLALLAVVGPFLVRVMTLSVKGVGAQMGRLTGIGTLGSFLGTILIAYLLIPRVPNSFSMYACAALLLCLGSVYFFVWEKSVKLRLTIFLWTLGALFLGFQAINRPSMSLTAFELVETRNSPFGMLQVIRSTNDSRRFYLNDYLFQNTYDPYEKKSTSSFTYLLHGLAWAYTPKIEKALCIGMGIGIVPMQLAAEGVAVDVVEINPYVLPVATNHFDFHPEKVKLHFEDGRYFVNRTANQYDTILLDAFLGDSSPTHLMSRESFAAMKRILKPDGTLVINTFGTLEPDRDFFTASLEKTLKAVFGTNVRVHSAGGGWRANVMFVASVSSGAMRQYRKFDTSQVHEICRNDVEEAFNTIIESNPRHGIVLTDDYNPVEVFDSVNREESRRRLVENIRGR